ncbi:hypothetical protein TNCV_2844212 [Trichonephila clavipes]|nr:hypothetical protein TNCV_2844212 [Trichonephila clavipes]
MSEGPILHIYKYGRKTELHTDACKQGYGAILLQEAEDGKLHPVYYMSKKTNTAEENISEDYVKKDLITRIARWALQLEEFDYEIEHRAGSRMKHVDALSRYAVMIVCNDTLTSKLKKAQEEDDNIQTLKSLLEKQESEEFFERNANKKSGEKEGFLNRISNERIPLSTYHVDFIGPLPSTNKNYQHIFTVVDAFANFTWLYPVKTVSAESALEKLKQQQKTFGNPIRIISDRGSAFTLKLFNDYCDEENIQHLQIATGVPRGNGQVERIHRTLIPVLTKLSLDDSTKWYKYVDRLQRILNSTICRSTKWTPFELLVGTKMRNKEDILMKDLLLEEMAKELLEQREFLRNDAKKNIETLHSENRNTYNRRRKKASLYKEGDLVAIQRTQFGAELKLRPMFLGPYKVTKVNSKDSSQHSVRAERPALSGEGDFVGYPMCKSIIAVKFCRLGELCLSFGLVQPFLSCKHYSSMCEKFGHRFPKDLKATAATMAGYQDLSKFERSITVGTRKIGHSISEVAMKFEFSHSTISRVYRECRESGKTSNLRHRCGRKKIMQERD